MTELSEEKIQFDASATRYDRYSHPLVSTISPSEGFSLSKEPHFRDLILFLEN